VLGHLRGSEPPWRPRKERYVAHLEEASPSALRVSLADKLHNVRSILRDHREIGEQVWELFNANRDEILWYYRSLVKVFARRKSGRMATELSDAVVELELLAQQAVVRLSLRRRELSRIHAADRTESGGAVEAAADAGAPVTAYPPGAVHS
jgi:hypothetical protein